MGKVDHVFSWILQLKALIRVSRSRCGCMGQIILDPGASVIRSTFFSQHRQLQKDHKAGS